MTSPVYVLGGAQTDFARNWASEGLGLFDMFAEVVPAACASGSTAVLAACADIEAGRYDLALVIGAELMRNVPAKTAAGHLGTAAWAGREAIGARFAWPALFAEVADAYEARYGLDHAVLGRFAEIAFANGRRNPLAQARSWTFEAGSFSEDDEVNPLVEGRLRKTDCGRITDGAAAVLLAGPRFAAERPAPRDGRSTTSPSSQASATVRRRCCSLTSSRPAKAARICSRSSTARSTTPTGERDCPVRRPSTSWRCMTASPSPVW
ncbi:beta-ketoacyl synthase N-terminal-like domain-containing protein [Streptosporangium sp. NPDC087985]|uniref:thiolase family protein n=1 Tax=Streptosporangium sp. NPDC087985 TaxID=3366196 RepID=UPI0038148C72